MVRSSRPHMPGYGLPIASEASGLLGWEWAAERLRNARRYWVSTVRPDSRPHCMVVWGLWREDRFYFSTGWESRKARNLRSNSSCVLAVERGEDAVVVEGAARLVEDEQHLHQLQQVYREKYGMGYPVESAVYVVEPSIVFGFIETPGQFQGTATRWEF